MTQHGGPTWWVLYALVPLMAGLLTVEHRAALPPGWHTFMQIGIVLCMYGLVWLWLQVNPARCYVPAWTSLSRHTYARRTGQHPGREGHPALRDQPREGMSGRSSRQNT
jgi:hypothetical protein